MKVGFIGSGNVARALGALLKSAGHDVAFGGRTSSDDGGVVAVANAVSGADLVVLAVPFLATRELLPALAGKLVVDATNPVNADWSPMLLGQESSAGEEVARMLPGARVVKAFNRLRRRHARGPYDARRSARHLLRRERP